MAKRHRKEQVGVVLSNKTPQTTIVEVTNLAKHPIFHKVVRQRKKYVAHNEQSTAKVGDKVRIKETRPMSRTKRWRVVEVLSVSK
ncbi:MAG: 30S ribosomal protein S17 [Omnitrophica bacterium RIFCSPHIGHO2_02_FULL_46_11]|nr:MAG: 30S ribosomal protein S17 [Omnitrophica bacterium RIFCSPHIGHO2_02_FULL_46_11]OGW86983.1 MAG: 30S ribosomal protein S17 [Omnitrophica bacterium RIFCSPLOWO2_01_FULL_45_10b]